MGHLIHRIDQRHQLAEKRDEWIDFSEQCAIAAPFCLPRVWLAWLEVFEQFDPVIYELRDGSELAALLPLYRDRTSLRIPTGEHLDYQDIAAVSDEAAATLLAAVVELEGKRGMTFTFDKVAEHSRLRVAIDDPGLSELASIRRRYWTLCPSANVEVKGTGRFLESLSARRRRDYNVSVRRIKGSYPDHVVEHRLGSEIDSDVIKAVAQLHRENQHRRTGDSIFDSGGFSEFLVRQALSDAPILLSMIRECSGGKLMAFNLGYFADDNYFYYITSYDGNYVSLSPGRRLFIETLCYCADRVRRGRLRYDLLSGEESYKIRWTTSFYEVERIQVIPKRIANLPRVAAYSAIYSLKSAKNHLLRWRAGGKRLGGLLHEPPLLTP